MYSIDNLENMTVADLKGIASSLEITGYSKKPKFELIDMIDEAQMSVISRDTFELRGVDELRYMAVDMGIRGMSKGRKEDLIDAILSVGGPADEVNAASGSFQVQNVPDKSEGTKIKVSCGASSGRFPVVGKEITAVTQLLSEVLNIDATAEPIVNGEEVDGEYLLEDGDTLEFTKRAGRKG